MHEMSLFRDLMQKIESIGEANPGKKIVKLNVKLGALSHLSPSHFQEHFNDFSKGTAAEGASVEIEADQDINAKDAQEVVLVSVEVEE